MRDLVEQMLNTTERRLWSVEGDDHRFVVAIAGGRIDFDCETNAIAIAFERLAMSVEAIVVAKRASRMMEVADVSSRPLPLWLVSGSDVLARWLEWAGTSNALRKVLTLTDKVGLTPVAGDLDRRARRELGQGGACIRVRGSMAVAERIELSDRPRCVALLGDHARLRIENHRLPDTLISALQQDHGSNASRSLNEVVSHPFFAAADLRFLDVVNDGAGLVFELDQRWAPLEPVPAAALAILPADADPMFPWRPTAAERRRLDALVEEARHRLAVKRDPR